VRYGAFVQVNNLTDRRNCRQVSPATGRCDVGAFDQARYRVGNVVAAESQTSTRNDNPLWIADRRAILTGLRVAF
jgi:hypothetical protein